MASFSPASIINADNDAIKSQEFAKDNNICKLPKIENNISSHPLRGYAASADYKSIKSLLKQKVEKTDIIFNKHNNTVNYDSDNISDHDRRAMNRTVNISSAYSASNSLSATVSPSSVRKITQSNRDPHSPIVLRPLTKLEQFKMSTIADRQRVNRTEKMVIKGKQFEGSGFSASPSTLVFADFELGKTYNKRITITNITPTFNSFRIEPLPIHLRSILEISYVPQSRMVSGKLCYIDVSFTPKENVDVDGIISVLTMTGTLKIPIQLRIKRSIVSASKKRLDFGVVVVAETVVRSVEIKNDGALASSFTIEGDALQLFQITHKSPVSGIEGSVSGDELPNKPNSTSNALFLKVFTSEPDLSSFASSGKILKLVVPPFSSLTITIKFTPLQPYIFHSNFFLSFEDPTIEDIVVFIKGEAIDIPVYISENSTINFGNIFFDVDYRETFTIKNNSQAATKVVPEILSEIKSLDVLEFVPNVGFIQPNSTFQFRVNFKPSKALISMSSQSQRECIFIRAIRIFIENQQMPVYLNIMANIASRSISISKPHNNELKLGSMYINLFVETTFVLTNGANISRKVGVISKPMNVEIFPPFDSVFTILPFEYVSIKLRVRPPGLGQFTQHIVLKTEHNDYCTLVVTGQGITPPLSITPPVVKFTPCTVDCSKEINVFLTNTSNTTTYEFDFLLLSRHGVDLMPRRGLIKPKEEFPLLLTFLPTRRVIDLTPPPPLPPFIPLPESEASVDLKIAKKKTVKDADEEVRSERKQLEAKRKQEYDENRLKREEEIIELRKVIPWEEGPAEEGDNDREENNVLKKRSLHRTLLIPCVIRKYVEKKLTLDSLEPYCTKPDASSLYIRPLFLQVSTCVIKTPFSLVIEDDLLDHKLKIPTPPVTPSETKQIDTKRSNLIPKKEPGGNLKGKKPSPKKKLSHVVPENPVSIELPNTNVTTDSSLIEPSLNDLENPIEKTLDFGDVPSFQCSIKKFLICNDKFLENGKPRPGAHFFLRIHVDPLDEYGTFKIERPPLPMLLPLQTTEIVIGFTPLEEASYRQNLRIICEAWTPATFKDSSFDNDITNSPSLMSSRYFINIELVGKGKPALLIIRPLPSTETKNDSDRSPIASHLQLIDSPNVVIATNEDKKSKTVDFGTCLPNDEVERLYEFVNQSSFALTVTSIITDIVNMNPNNTFPFTLTPSKVTIPPQSRICVSFMFSPLIATQYSAKGRVVYGDKDSFIGFNLYGICTLNELLFADDQCLIH